MHRSRLVHGLVNWLRKHAEADRNSITVTVAPAQAERTFQIDLPRWSLRLLAVILIVSFVLVLAGGILYGKLLRDAVVLREVRQENEVLRARAARLKEIEEDVAQLERVRKQLYAIAGVPEAEAGSIAEKEAPAGEHTMDSPEAHSETPRTDATSPDREAPSSPAAMGAPLTTLPYRGPISRGFSIASGRSPEHTGVDVAGREGADVLAAGDGMVIFAGEDETFGNLVIIAHPGGWETKYGHNRTLLVAQGDSVRSGQTIALLGSTGKSSAPHVHFEIHHDGTAVDPGSCFPAYRSRP
jgi:murein DD-endopeptidase MepM/ murein hydrolase activator NlpD